MADRLILETTFLIDLERELVQGSPGPAQDFLADHPASQLYITFTVAGELAAGVTLDRRARWEQFIAPFQILPYTPDVCWEYGQAFRFLQANGLLIGANDLLRQEGLSPQHSTRRGRRPINRLMPQNGNDVVTTATPPLPGTNLMAHRFRVWRLQRRSFPHDVRGMWSEALASRNLGGGNDQSIGEVKIQLARMVGVSPRPPVDGLLGRRKRRGLGGQRSTEL